MHSSLLSPRELRRIRGEGTGPIIGLPLPSFQAGFDVPGDYSGLVDVDSPCFQKGIIGAQLDITSRSSGVLVGIKRESHPSHSFTDILSDLGAVFADATPKDDCLGASESG